MAHFMSPQDVERMSKVFAEKVNSFNAPGYNYVWEEIQASVKQRYREGMKAALTDMGFTLTD
jgi:hypothetical protein